MKKVSFFGILLAFCMVLSMNAFAFGPVQYGDSGYEVEEVQRMLIDLGYLDDWADGQFGPMTQAAVTDFQYDRGLDVDGIVGNQTYNELVWLTSNTAPDPDPDPVLISPAAGSWQYDGYGWWYLNSDGTYPVSDWRVIDDEMYHFDDWGYMDTGWILDSDGWYYLYPDGAKAYNCWIWDGAWYYMGIYGKMQTGWLFYGDDWYFLSDSGEMLTGTYTIDGVEYTFDDDGVLVESGSERALVTDAYYKTYDDVWGTNYYHVPQINIDSEDIRALNAEMYKQYVFDIEYAIYEAELEGSIVSLTGMSYEWYVNGDILSLVVHNAYFESPHYYYVYNISISGGYRLSDEYIYGLYGLSYWQYHDLIEQNITDELDSRWSEASAYAYESDLEESIRWIDFDARAFIGENWELNVLTTVKTSTGQQAYHWSRYVIGW